MQYFKAISHTLPPLLDQITTQIQVRDPYFHQGQKIVGANGKWEVRKTPFSMEELGCPCGKRTEKQRFLAVENACIEMGNGHRRSRIERLPVNLRLMPGDDLGIVAHQPLASDRKSTKSPCLRNTRCLQEWKTSSPSTNKNEFRAARMHITRSQMPGCYFPRGVDFF